MSYDAAFVASLDAAPADGIAGAFFLHVTAKDGVGTPVDFGFWTGEENITQSVATPDGSTTSRDYVGGVDLKFPEGIPLVAGLTDESVTAVLSHISEDVQTLVRAHQLRLAEVEVHVTTWSGGAFSAIPALEWSGVIDLATIETGAVGSSGAVALTIRSFWNWLLGRTNPAKSSDAHQKARQSGDQFCQYASTAGIRQLDWGL